MERKKSMIATATPKMENQLLIAYVMRAELMSHYGVEYNILTVVNQKVASNITEIYEFYKKTRMELPAVYCMSGSARRGTWRE